MVSIPSAMVVIPRLSPSRVIALITAFCLVALPAWVTNDRSILILLNGKLCNWLNEE